MRCNTADNAETSRSAAFLRAFAPKNFKILGLRDTAWFYAVGLVTASLLLAARSETPMTAQPHPAVSPMVQAQPVRQHSGLHAPDFRAYYREAAKTYADSTPARQSRIAPRMKVFIISSVAEAPETPMAPKRRS